MDKLKNIQKYLTMFGVILALGFLGLWVYAQFFMEGDRLSIHYVAIALALIVLSMNLFSDTKNEKG